MNVKPENLTRALAILRTQPDEFDVMLYAGTIYVRGQKLTLGEPDDAEVLSVLMADKEFGFAVSGFENASNTLRKMQMVWCDAATAMKKEAAA